MVDMDVALELEDDVFFADLSQRIALLIMDDDGGGGEAAFQPQRPSISFQAYSYASQPAVPSGFCYEQACRREIRGTGVFIPQSSLPRRKQRAGRSRHSDKSRAPASAAAVQRSGGGGGGGGGSNSQSSKNYCRNAKRVN